MDSKPCLPSSGGERIEMKRKITLMSAVSIIVGSIIGSGIFVSPGGVLKYVDSGATALIIWTVCGFICTAGALCFSELGTMLPSSGGEYTYILHAFGGLPAFLTLWTNVLVIRPGAQAVVANAFAEYALAPIFPDCPPPKIASVLLAAAALSLLTFINCSSVSLAMKIQNVFTAAKLFALIAIIIFGMIQLVQGRTIDSSKTLSQEGPMIGGISMALYSGLFAYAGWNYVNFVTEELQEPTKNLPRSIWIAMPLVTIIYIMANVAYLVVLSPEEIVTSSAVAVLFGQRALGPLQYAVPVFVALSTFGSLNGILFTSGRLYLTGAREGHLPPVLSFINIKTRTPIPALLLTCILSFFMIGFEIFFLINCVSFVLWLSIGLATAALLWMRRTKPNLHRPIKVNLAVPVIFLAVCVFLVVVPVITEPKSTGLGILLTMTGLPFYLVGVKWRKKPEAVVALYQMFEVLIQKTLYVVPPMGWEEVPLLEKPTKA